MTTRTSKQHRLRPSPVIYVAMAAAGLTVIGSLGPWAQVTTKAYTGGEVRFLTVPGIGEDGMFTLVLAALAGGLILLRLLKPNFSSLALGTAFVLISITALAGLINWLDAATISGDFSYRELPPAARGFVRTDVAVGWGVMVTTLAAIIGVVSTGYNYWIEHVR